MKKILKGLAAVGLLIVLAIGFVFFRFSSLSNKKFPTPKIQIAEDVAKADVNLGRRIYAVRNACIECHGANLAGVKVMDNPAMGSIYGANISPYTLKDWSDEQIAAAIRYGIGKDGRPLRFMPSMDFTYLSKSDVAAVIAYLRSVAPVEAESHKNTFGPVAKALSVFGNMPVMFPAYDIDQSKGFADKPNEGPTAEFGRYLAWDCRGCHGAEFKGGRIPGGDPSWPMAADIRLGTDTFWTEVKFRGMISSGISPKTGKAIRAPMPMHLLKQYNDMEVKALWLFLSTLK